MLYKMIINGGSLLPITQFYEKCEVEFLTLSEVNLQLDVWT